MRYVLSIILLLAGFLLLGQDESNPCLANQNFHIVVLGSSTAAGTGPSTSDSTWVNRYRKFLQQINPGNQVTNLGVGGTTTYHIMPDWFTPPAFRASPSITKNVSAAIALGADAIIINMPSNDASNNIGLNEQMANFTTIAAVADSVNIPVWVCTTQPKNYSNPVQIQIQLDVRDSIISYFGKRAIDFWTGIANSSNTIDSIYDSGDGTHLNDLAHRVLYNRVKGENILSEINDTLPYTDYAISSFDWMNPSICGDTASRFRVIIANLGAGGSDSLYLTHEVLNLTLGTYQYFNDTIQIANSCDPDTFYFGLPTHLGVNLNIKTYLHSNSDTVLSNDTSNFRLTTEGLPAIWLSYSMDTLCAGDALVMKANTVKADTVLWWNNGKLIGTGDSLNYTGVLHSDTLIAKSVKGDLFYKNSIFTTINTNIDFNGIMFDLVAHDTLVIDSLSLKLSTAGDQGIIGYYRLGSYQAQKANPTAWTYWGVDSVFGITSGSFNTIQYSSINLLPNDTLGIYLHLEDPASQLSYENNGNEIKKSTNELDLISGSGITYTFGTEYYPRYWSGELFYHFGFNPDGDCSTDLIIPLTISKSTLNLGPDRVVGHGALDTIDGGEGFVSYTWNWLENQNLFQLQGRNFIIHNGPFSSPGSYVVWLEAIDSNGCLLTDTIVIDYAMDFGLDEDNTDLQVYPNPSEGSFHVNTLHSGMLEILTRTGQIVSRRETRGYETFDVNLKSGVYLLVLTTDKGYSSQKLVIY